MELGMVCGPTVGKIQLQKHYQDDGKEIGGVILVYYGRGEYIQIVISLERVYTMSQQSVDSLKEVDEICELCDKETGKIYRGLGILGCVHIPCVNEFLACCNALVQLNSNIVVSSEL